MYSYLLPHAWFAALNAATAFYYWKVALISNSSAPPEYTVFQALLFDAPLGIATLAALFGVKIIPAKKLPWILLTVLIVLTVWMHQLGHNFAGAFVGFVNLVLCWGIALKAIIAFFGAVNESKEQGKDTKLSVSLVMIFTILGLGPFSYVTFFYYTLDNSPFIPGKAYENHFAMRCLDAKELIHYVPENVEGVYVEHEMIPKFSSVINNSFGMERSESLTRRLFRERLIKFKERPSSYAWDRIATDAKYERSFSRKGKERELVDDLKSKYGVFVTSTTNVADKNFRVEGYEISIRDLSTDEVTATSSYFYNSRLEHVCGQARNSTISGSDFVARALGLY